MLWVGVRRLGCYFGLFWFYDEVGDESLPVFIWFFCVKFCFSYFYLFYLCDFLFSDDLG